MPGSASEAKTQMFPSIILNVSLFARWYWNVLKVSHLISSVPSTNRINRVNYRLFGTPVVPAYISLKAATIYQHKRTNVSSV